MEIKKNYEVCDDAWYENQKITLSLELYKCRYIHRKGVDNIIKLFDKFISGSTLKNIEYKTLKAKEKQKDLNECMEIILYESQSPFKNLRSEKQRFAVYRKKCSYKDPLEFTVGLMDNARTLTQSRITAVHLSLASQFQIFFEIPNLLREVLKYNYKVNRLFEDKGIYSNVLHGKLWQKNYKSLFIGKTVFPVFLFFDDFETGNALGSHAGKQKFGGMYVALPTLPPHLRAKLKNIFLATIFYSDHWELSNNEVFRKIIIELNTLSQEGLTVNINNESRQLFFQCVSLLGDNLGLNQICGFEGSFSAKNYCRRCRVSSETCKFLTCESLCDLRTVDHYEQDLKSRENGVKHYCIFNEIENFHIIKNPSLDLMHDLFEGIAKYTIEGVLTNLILINKKISLESVNSSIDNFSYGTLESKNKPQPL